MAVNPAGRSLHSVSGAKLISILARPPVGFHFWAKHVADESHMQTPGLVCLHGSWNFPLKGKLTDNMTCTSSSLSRDHHHRHLHHHQHQQHHLKRRFEGTRLSLRSGDAAEIFLLSKGKMFWPKAPDPIRAQCALVGSNSYQPKATKTLDIEKVGSSKTHILVQNSILYVIQATRVLIAAIFPFHFWWYDLRS